MSALTPSRNLASGIGQLDFDAERARRGIGAIGDEADLALHDFAGDERGLAGSPTVTSPTSCSLSVADREERFGRDQHARICRPRACNRRH